MTTDDGREIEIFTEALQLAAGEREAFLDKACAGDEKLRRKIEALLRSNDRVAGFLDLPAAPTGDGWAKPLVGEKPGDQVGRYKLLQQIGEGGCGIVFIAEQEQPIRRRVALKVIKPGMDTKSVIARFEAERQALALMDHPNIAHVYDAGTTENGRPYFVMELVEGLKITDYCDQHSLPIEARLELFVQVCDAIQHAHQKGIIHRDIKPSNVLVATAPDGKPMPKVIDFGIAKATGGQRLTDKTIFTAREMVIGTPAYMSPEQATLSSVDVDTRTDIYSLGVLLYELLTGLPPFDTQELLKAGFDEMRRVIREEEPMRPSTRLCTMVAGNPNSISNHHVAKAPKLIREMRSELDWIVMKALEKDRARRYATANGLAMDIERYISGEAVLARPPNPFYKARKLIGRNKLLSSSLAAFVILLAASLVVTIRSLAIERQTRERLQHQNDVYKFENLGLVYGGNLAEAEGYFRQSFKLRHKFLNNEPPNADTVVTFCNVMKNEGKLEEAGSLLAPFLTTSNHVDYQFLFGNMASDLAAKGRFKAALFDATFLAESKPDLSATYHVLAPLLVACGDADAYRRLPPQIIQRFGGTRDRNTADQMAKDCLILPSPGTDLKAVGALADLAVTLGTHSVSFPLFQCCKALAEYRQEHFAEAIKWAGSAVTNTFPYSQAEGYAVLAMAQFQSDQTNQARESLENCNTVIEEKLPKLSSGEIGQDWRDWIIAHALQSEAKQMIDGESPPATPPTNAAR